MVPITALQDVPLTVSTTPTPCGAPVVLGLYFEGALLPKTTVLTLEAAFPALTLPLALGSPQWRG
jgi:hypothetical protein